MVKEKRRSQKSLMSSFHKNLNTPKTAIEFPDRKNRIRGVAVLMFMDAGLVKQIDKNRYIIPNELKEYLDKKKILYTVIDMPTKKKASIKS